MKDKIIVSDYFQEETEQSLNSAAFDKPVQDSKHTFQQGVLQESFSTSRLSHFRDSNSCLGLGYMPLNSTSDIGYNQYPVYCNNVLFNFDSDSYSSEDPLLFNSQQLIIPDEQLLTCETQQQESNMLSSLPQNNPNLERLDSCVSEISTSSERSLEIDRTSVEMETHIPKQSLFDMSYSTFSSDTESIQESRVLFERSPRMTSHSMKNSCKISTLPSLETLRKQVNCELNIQTRRFDDMIGQDLPSLNIIMAGCSFSGKSQLKSLLSSVMEFESERILPDSESYPKLVFRPIYRNLDHGSRTYQVNQDETQLSFYKWDENISRCSVMFQPMDSQISDQIISQRIMFTDMPGLSNLKDCANYCKLISQLYVGMYVSEMDDKMVEYGFENIKAGGRIQNFMYHDIVFLTVPIEFTQKEIQITRTLQKYLDSKGIPYLVVATKTDLVENERKVLEKKKEIAKLLSMRSFEILTIGMSGKSKEGIEDFELVRNELHKEIMVIIRQLLLQSNKKRSFPDYFKLRHGGLSTMEFSIKMVSMCLFHYWLILHKVIHWIVIGPGVDEILQEEVEESMEKPREQEGLEALLFQQTQLDESEHLKKPCITNPTPEPVNTHNQPFQSEQDCIPIQKDSLTCNPMIFSSTIPTIPPPTENPFMSRGPSNPIILSNKTPSVIPLQSNPIVLPPKHQQTQILRDVIQSPSSSSSYDSDESSESSSDVCEDDHNPISMENEQESIYYSRFPPKSHQTPECEEEFEEQIGEEHATGYYLCSMRIFQCLVVSLLFVLVFQSFALFAFQHLSAI